MAAVIAHVIFANKPHFRGASSLILHPTLIGAQILCHTEISSVPLSVDIILDVLTELQAMNVPHLCLPATLTPDT